MITLHSIHSVTWQEWGLWWGLNNRKWRFLLKYESFICLNFQSWCPIVIYRHSPSSLFCERVIVNTNGAPCVRVPLRYAYMGSIIRYRARFYIWLCKVEELGWGATAVSKFVHHITVTSWWARLRLKLPASRLFTQLLFLVQIKENIKAPRHWPWWGEFTGDRWIPHTKGQ